MRDVAVGHGVPLVRIRPAQSPPPSRPPQEPARHRRPVSAGAVGTGAGGAGGARTGSATGGRASARCRSSASSAGRWPFTSRSRAASVSVHSARSTSGNDAVRPERGGHSSSNSPNARPSSENPLPSATNTVIRLPDEYANVPSSAYGASGGSTPSSSRNSRQRGIQRASSPSANSPLGIDHAPASLLAQNGPPMCAMSTSGGRGEPIEQDAGAGESRSCSCRSSGHAGLRRDGVGVLGVASTTPRERRVDRRHGVGVELRRPRP